MWTSIFLTINLIISSGIVTIGGPDKVVGVETIVSTPSVPGHAVRTMEATHETPALFTSISLCTLLSVASFAGYYKVAAINTGLEDGINPNGGTQKEPFTYVTMHRIVPWSDNAPIDVVARMPGGFYDNGHEMWEQVAVKVGENVGYIGTYLPINKGFPGMTPLLTFHAKPNGKGMSNSQLFLDSDWTADNIGFIVSTNMAAGKKCPLEVMPSQAGPKWGEE